MSRLIHGSALLLTLGAAVVLAGGSSAETFGSVVEATSDDATHVLVRLRLDPAFVDRDGDGLLDGDEPVYLSPAAGTVQGNDVRIANAAPLALGSQVRATDPDVGDLTISLPGSSMFHDADGDALFSAGDTWYWDTDASGMVTTGDLVLSGDAAGTVAAPADAQINLPLTVIPFTPSLFDADGDSALTRGDGVYQDSNADGFATVQDVRLVPGPGTAFGSVVGPEDADATFVLAALGFVPVFVDDDADTLFDGDEPVYLSPAAGTVQGNDVRIANPGAFPLGSQVRASHSDFGNPTTAMPGLTMFYDADGDMLFGLGDDLIWDTDASSTVTILDVYLSGPSAGTVVAAGHPERNNVLTAIALTTSFFDGDGNAAYTLGDLVYQDSYADGFATVQDIRLRPAGGKAFGSAVAQGDPDATGLLASLGFVPVFVDEDADAAFDGDEPVYLSPAAGTVQGNDVRIANPGAFPLGSQVRASHSDFGNPTTAMPGLTMFYDADGNARFSAGDGLYWDTDGSGTVTVNDLSLGGSGAGSPVSRTHAGLNNVLTAIALTVSFLDADGDTVYTRGDILYQDSDGDGYVTVQDVQLSLPGGGGTTPDPDPGPEPDPEIPPEPSPGPQGNARPLAILAPQEPVECTGRAGVAVLDGTASRDPEGKALSFRWTADDGSIEWPDQPRTRATFPLGATTVHLAVSDGELVGVNSTVVRVRDTEPPATAVDLAGRAGEGGWWRSPVEVSLAGTDRCGVAATRYTLDGGPERAGDFLVVAGDGRHVVRYATVDVAGNAEPPRDLDVLVDTTPPTTRAEVLSLAGGAGGWWRGNVEVFFHVRDAGSGVASRWHSVDGGPWIQAASATVAGDGVHEVRFYAVDVAGNVEPQRTLTVRIDATPPTASAALRGVPGELGWWRSAVAAAVQARDGLSGVASVHVAVDGGPSRLAEAATLAGDGAHTLAFYAVDVAGNAGPVQVLEVPIDATPPRAALRDPAPGTAHAFDLVVVEGTPATVVVGDKTVRGAGSDATSGLARLELWVDGVRNASARPDAQGEAAILWAASKAALGEHEVAIRAVDEAGNAALASLAVLVVPASPEGALATAEHCEGLASAAVCALLPDDPDAACRLALAPWICDLAGDVRGACALVLADGVCAVAPEEAPVPPAAVLPATPLGLELAPARRDRALP